MTPRCFCAIIISERRWHHVQDDKYTRGYLRRRSINSTILGMIDAGMTGHLVDVNTPDAQVVITVEDYEG